MKRYYEKYKHIIPLAIFGVIYVLWFYLLEHRTNVQYMVVHMNIDDYIPFCEYFVVPYLLWFAYVPAVLGYLFFKDRRNYDRCAVFLCTGMLIFLVISTFIPNIQHLRLHTMPRHNVFTVLVSQLWQTDTPTNLFPSIHVYNSLGAAIAIGHSQALKKHRGIQFVSYGLAGLIVLSTMFLKQHSVTDVIAAVALTFMIYPLIYVTQTKRAPKLSQQPI